MSGIKKIVLTLSSMNPRPRKLTSWVEEELGQVVNQHGQGMGMKPSQIIRRLIILGLAADGVEVVSDIKPQKGK